MSERGVVIDIARRQMPLFPDAEAAEPVGSASIRIRPTAPAAPRLTLAVKTLRALARFVDRGQRIAIEQTLQIEEGAFGVVVFARTELCWIALRVSEVARTPRMFHLPCSALRSLPEKGVVDIAEHADGIALHTHDRSAAELVLRVQSQSIRPTQWRASLPGWQPALDAGDVDFDPAQIAEIERAARRCGIAGLRHAVVRREQHALRVHLSEDQCFLAVVAARVDHPRAIQGATWPHWSN